MVNSVTSREPFLTVYLFILVYTALESLGWDNMVMTQTSNAYKVARTVTRQALTGEEKYATLKMYPKLKEARKYQPYFTTGPPKSALRTLNLAIRLQGVITLKKQYTIKVFASLDNGTRYVVNYTNHYYYCKQKL